MGSIKISNKLLLVIFLLFEDLKPFHLPPQESLQVTDLSDLVQLVKLFLASAEMNTTPELKMTSKLTRGERVIRIWTKFVFLPFNQKTTLTFSRQLQASIHWTLTPCPSSAAQRQQLLSFNTAKMEPNGRGV